MKSIGVIIFCAICVYDVYARPEQEITNYNFLTLDQIFNDDKLLRGYVNCLLDKGDCNTAGVELKYILPILIQSNCTRCTEVQKNGAVKLVNFLIKNKRSWWSELEIKYDPDGTYTKKYESEIKEHGVNV